LNKIKNLIKLIYIIIKIIRKLALRIKSTMREMTEIEREFRKKVIKFKILIEFLIFLS